MRSQLLILSRIPSIWWVTFLSAIKILSVFAFGCLTVVCPSVDLFELDLFGVCWASWAYRLMFFHQCGGIFGNYSSLLFLPFSLCLSLVSLSSWDSHYVHISILNGVSTSVWGSVSFSSLFFSFCFLDCIISVDLF